MQEEPEDGSVSICFNAPRVSQGQALTGGSGMQAVTYGPGHSWSFPWQPASVACPPAPSDTVYPICPSPVAKARMIKPPQVTVATSGSHRKDVHRVLRAEQHPVPGGWSGLHCSAPTPAGPPAPCLLYSMGREPSLGPSQGTGNWNLGAHHPIRLSVGAWRGLQGFWGPQKAAGPAQGESGQLFPCPGGRGNL